MSESTDEQPTYLGLDLGTSGLRAVVLTSSGVPLHSISSPPDSYRTLHPHPSHSEQDPDFWIRALRLVLDSLRVSHPAYLRNVRGIGIAGHMHGLVALDEHGAPVTPCMLWNDTRSACEATKLSDEHVDFMELSGNDVFPGFTAPKLQWLRKHNPHAFALIHQVLLPKDYLLFFLTGHYATECSDASGTALFSVRQRKWSTSLIAHCSVLENHLPQVYEGCDVVASIRPELANEFGLPTDAVVVAGAADNAAAACGLGAVKANDAFVSLGTSGVMFVCTGDVCAPRPGVGGVHTFCHAVPDTWYIMGVMLCATDSLNWLGEMTSTSVSELVSLLPYDVTDGPGDVLFLPYLSGERTPHNEAKGKGTFLGLRRNTTKKELVRAVMEGVAYGMRDCVTVLDAYHRIKSVGVVATGGGAQSDLWLDIVANVLDVCVSRPKEGVDTGAAVGAGRLAILGCEKNEKSVEEVMRKPEIERKFVPRREVVKKYSERYENFTRAYNAIKDLTS